jgi:hypothetical protein
MIENMKKKWYNIQKLIQTNFKYPIELVGLYNDYNSISPRSIYNFTAIYEEQDAKGWIEILKTYGKNWKLEFPYDIKATLRNILEDKLGSWVEREQRGIRDIVEEGKWLSHIKEGRNSGYPYNKSQTKQDALDIVDKVIILFEKYKNGEMINWHKLAYSMGMRAERKFKQRVIAMAAFVEKIIGALINSVLDKFADGLPFALPRMFGALDELMKTILKVQKKGVTLCLDYDAFDSTVPVELLRILRDFFKSIGTDFALMIAFDIDLMIHGELIVDKRLGFKMKSIYSGSGTTQFIGSLINWLIAEYENFSMIMSVFQGDDTLMITLDDIEAVNAKIKDIKEVFNMDISPVGKKTFYSEHFGIILQTIADGLNGYYYGQELRKFVNLFLRERALNVEDQKYEYIYGVGGKELNVLAQCDSWLGTLASYGNKSPVLPYVVADTYGKRSGFTWNQVKSVLPHLGLLSLGFDNFERITLKNDYFRDIMLNLHRKHGWGSVTSAQVMKVMT